jgi:basic membrane protein A
VTSVDFIEEESAFLAGVVAGMLTVDTSIPNVNEQKIIGAVGGDVDPVIDAFMFAYENGAKYVDPEIANERKYLGDWEDTAKAKQATLQLYDLGADIVFQIAAAAGMGVLQASGERDLYSIGVDLAERYRPRSCSCLILRRWHASPTCLHRSRMGAISPVKF